MFRAAHRDLGPALYDRSKDGVAIDVGDAKPPKKATEIKR
jgi:hypothetical protein